MTSPHSVNVPSIRFKGFTDVWEECKLEEICNYYASSLSAKHINNEGIYDLYDANTIIGKTNTDCMKEDYITIIKDGAGVGRTRLLPKGSMFLGTMGAITPRNSNLDFLYQLVSNANLGSLYTGSTIPHIYFKDYGKNTYHVPHIVEQEQIGAFFYNIDHYITFYRYKYDKLQNIKKSMLEKMFPKNGSNIPEIRFAGFTDAWEQRKLSDLIIEYKETVDSDCTLPVLTSSKTEGVVLQEEHFGRVQNHDITGYNILPRNYCTYRNRSDGVDFTFNINRCCDKGIISKFYPVFYGNNSDIFFISMVLNYCDEVVHEIAYTCTGTGQKVLSFLDLQKMNIRVPSYDEQKKISQYFEQLDNLITLHQRKLEKLQNIKKMMLEKMFV